MVKNSEKSNTSASTSQNHDSRISRKPKTPVENAYLIKANEAVEEFSLNKKLNSDNYSLVDFYEIDADDIFAKTYPYLAYVEDFKAKGYFSYKRPLLSACKNRVKVYDDYNKTTRSMIMMASNNYLGLADHPKVVGAAIKALEKYGSSGSSAPLLSGTFDITRNLEAKVAELKSCESAIAFSTGYSANVGLISSLLRPNDVAIIDKLVHASIIDGCKLSGAHIRVYRHSDMKSLESCLKSTNKKYRSKLIITDGVFGMDGDICNLPEIKTLADKYGARIMIDDAHATGVLGQKGKGTAELFGMEGQVDLTLGTFSKSLAGVGGFVASSKEVITYIRYYARSYFFSGALPPSVIASVDAAIDVLYDEPHRIKQLHDNVAYLHKKFSDSGLQVSQLGTGIISVIIGDELTLRKMSKDIHNLGLYINPLPYPSVPKDASRFKFSLMATHTKEDLDETADIFIKVCRKFDIL